MSRAEVAQRWSRWSYPIVAVVLAGLAMVQLLVEQPDGPLGFAAAVSVAAVAGLLLLPNRPLAATCVVVGGVAVLFVLLPNPPFATFVATLLACYGLVRHGSRPQITAGLGILAVVLTVTAVYQTSTGEDEPFAVVYPLVYFGGAGLVGWLTRSRADHLQVVRERADALERERVARDELAAAAERTRIARDLHDVVAHGVSLMVVQAEAAREVIDSRPQRAAEALDAIAETGRRAVDDLREMLGMLRTPEAPEHTGISVDDLVEQVRTAGFEVELDVHGAPRPVEPKVAQTVRRVVQEALTNAIRHSDARCGRVQLWYADDEVSVLVRDEGAPRPSPLTGAGQGLRGMAERIAEIGGELEVGPDDEGFVVRARIPIGSGT